MTLQSCYWHNKNPFPTGFLQFDKCVVAICFTLEIKLQMSLVTVIAVSTVAVPICCLIRCCRIPCFCNSLLCINLLSGWRLHCATLSVSAYYIWLCTPKSEVVASTNSMPLSASSVKSTILKMRIMSAHAEPVCHAIGQVRKHRI